MLSRALGSPYARRVAPFAAVFVIVLVACYVGILARMSQHLSSFWPANAVLAGFLLRYPALNRLSGWIAAFVAYMTADLTTGGGFGVTLGLTLANLAGVIAVVAVAQGAHGRRRYLAEPSDLLALGGAAIAGACAATVVGIPCSMIAFDSTIADATRSWFAGELAQYVALLPVILTAPPWRELRRSPARRRLVTRLTHHAPLLALPVAIALGAWIGGPTALMIVLPLLLWSALKGEIHQTAVLALLATGWNLVALGSELIEVTAFGTSSELSIKTGLALLAAGPLAVAAAVTSRDEALRQVHHLARHDVLTGLLNRRAFLDDADAIHHRALRRATSITVFMVDLDHFKAINDRFGHPTGDALLAAVGSALDDLKHPDAVIGRLGGEEFAMAVAGLSADEVGALGETLRHTVATAATHPAEQHAGSEPITVNHLLHRELLRGLEGWPISASIGVATGLPTPSTSITTLLVRADQQLYAAKRAGRDQVRGTPYLDGL